MEENYIVDLSTWKSHYNPNQNVKGKKTKKDQIKKKYRYILKKFDIQEHKIDEESYFNIYHVRNLSVSLGLILGKNKKVK